MATTVPVWPVEVSVEHDGASTDVAAVGPVVADFTVAGGEMGSSGEQACSETVSHSMESAHHPERLGLVLRMTSLSSRFGSNRNGERGHTYPIRTVTTHRALKLEFAVTGADSVGSCG